MSLTITKVNLPQSQYAIKCPYTMNPEGLTIHNTANDASAMAEVSYMQGNPYEVSFHYAVDDTRAVQGLPLNRNGWHAGDGGSGKGNRKTIGLEICYSKSGGTRFIEAEKNGAILAAMILKSRGWGIERMGKHQDYWQGTYYKYCPHRTLDLGWKRFVNMVQAELNKLNGSNTSTSKPAKSKFKVGDKVKVKALYANSKGDGKSTKSAGKIGVIKRDVGKGKRYLVEDWVWAHENDIELVKTSDFDINNYHTTKFDMIKLIKDDYAYKDVSLKNKVGNKVKKGTILTVTGIEYSGKYPRFKLKSGLYITTRKDTVAKYK